MTSLMPGSILVKFTWAWPSTIIQYRSGTLSQVKLAACSRAAGVAGS